MIELRRESPIIAYFAFVTKFYLIFCKRKSKKLFVVATAILLKSQLE